MPRVCAGRAWFTVSLPCKSHPRQAGRKLAKGENNSLYSFVLTDISKNRGSRQGNGGKRFINIHLKVHSLPLQLLPINHSTALSPAGDNIAGLLNQNHLTPGSQLLTSGKQITNKTSAPSLPRENPISAVAGQL